MASSNIFFTADHHFNHQSILAGGTWGWRAFSSVNEMNEYMVDTWNRVVRRGDRVYHLGDFAFSGRRAPSSAADIARRLNGQKYLIRGNHDHTSLWDADLRDRFVWIRDRFQLRVSGLGPLGGHLYLFLDHYPLRSWNRRSYGALHLFGHVHGALDTDLLPGTLDVGVDSWSFEPVPLEHVLVAIDANTYWQNLTRSDHGL